MGDNLSLKQMKQKLRDAGVDFSTFVEKQEFIDAVKELPSAVDEETSEIGSVTEGSPSGPDTSSEHKTAQQATSTEYRKAQDAVDASATICHFQDVEELDDVEVVDSASSEVNVEARNDQLIAIKPIAKDATLKICEQMWLLRLSAVITAEGQVPFLGVAPGVDLLPGFSVAALPLGPLPSEQLAEEKSFRVLAFDEQQSLGYLQEDGVTPKLHFDTALLRQQPGYRLSKAYLDLKCQPIQAPTVNQNTSEEAMVEMKCSEWLERLCEQRIFGEDIPLDTIVLGMTACKVFGVLANPPPAASESAPSQ